MDTIQVISERRSINFFDPDIEISEQAIGDIISIANLAPSSFNLQPWRVVAVTDKERKKALRKCAFGQPKVEEASAVLIIIAEPDAVEKNGDRVVDDLHKKGYMESEDQKEKTKEMMAGLYGEKESVKRKLFAVKNSALFAMNLMITAGGFGYETHPMDGIDEDAVKREFGIPEDKIVPLLIALGKFKKGAKLGEGKFRRDLKEYTTFNSY